MGRSDRALDEAANALWLAHNTVMQGGVLHCVEVLSASELHAAIAAYRLFGLSAAADIIAEARALDSEEAATREARLDKAYAKAVPTEDTIDAAIKAREPRSESRRSRQPGSVDEAVQEFVEASHESVHLGIARGKTRQQHRAHERTESAVRALLHHWDSGGHEALLALLEHADPAVSVTAATYLAESDPNRAIPILEHLKETEPAVRLAASGALFAIRRDANFHPLSRLTTSSIKER